MSEPSQITGATFVDNYVSDMGSDDADITSHDTYVTGVPHATFTRLRNEDPVHWTEESDGSGFWSIMRHSDAMRVSRDVSTFTSADGIRLEQMTPDELEARRTLMEMDPPEHTRYRRLVAKGFTGRAVAEYEDQIRQLAVDVIEEALPKGEFDFVHEIAQQLPMRMLGRMLGTSDEEGRQMVVWGDALLGNTDPEFTDYPVDLTDTEEFRMIPFRSPAALEIFEFAQQKAEERRACPGHDLISQLLQPTKSGEPLTDHEFDNFFTLLVAAGNDTTRYTMAHCIWNLMQYPDLWNTWKGNDELTTSAIEEVLRASSVTMHFRRTATVDVEFGGKQIRKGDRVVMWFVSANHDEDAFVNPFRFDLLRSPNDHMTFGRSGPHFCLGAWLARMEVKVVMEELFKRVDILEPAGEPERLRSNFIAGIKRLPVRVVG